MARKLIQTLTNPTPGNPYRRADEARVYRDAEWDEFRVVFYCIGIDGVAIKREGADYHTNDKQDAIDTASAVLTRGL